MLARPDEDQVIGPVEGAEDPAFGSGFEAALLDQIPVAVIATDLAGRVTLWNRHAETLYGWSHAEATDRDIFDLLAVDEDVLAGKEIMDRVRSGQTWDGEFRVRRRDGSMILCQVTDSPILDSRGNVVGVLGMSIDIGDRKRAENRIKARTAVTRVLAEAASLSNAAQEILRAMCEGLDWDVGAIWTVDEQANVLRCVDVWQRSPATAGKFEEVTRESAFSPGVGLPGRVWSSGEPAWIPDVVLDPNFPRAAFAEADGLHGAFGFPIRLAGEVLGVFELFSAQIREPDQDLLMAIAVIGSQIGQFIERKQAEEELRASRDQLQAIFQGVSEGITVQDVTGAIVYANDAAARTLGFPSLEALLTTPVADVMKNFEVLNQDGSPFPLEKLPGRRALQFGETSESIIRFRVVSTGKERWSWVRASPILAEEGKVRFAVNIFHDVTDERLAQEGREFLAEASEILSESLEWEETLRRVTELAVPSLADWCTVAMRQEDGSAAQLMVQHVDPSKVRLAEDLQRRYPPGPGQRRGADEVIRTGRAELYPEITEEMLAQAARDPEHLSILKDLGFRSAMVVPLKVRNRTIGALTFVSAESGRRYGQAELSLAEELARRAAMAVENARLFKERDEIARKLQESLLPPELPAIPGLELASRYHAAGRGFEVGGDFYDVFSMGGSGWGLVIGDVCGKGPEAAGLTGLVRHTIRASAMQERKPSQILARLNEAVIEQRSDSMFCTVCFLRVKPNEGGARLTISCGGHPLPLVMRANGSVESAGVPGTLLGVFPDPDLRDKSIDLGRGDAIVLYTDGVIEERAPGAVFGRDRLTALLESCRGLDAANIAESVERAVLGFRPEDPRDDIALLVLRVSP